MLYAADAASAETNSLTDGKRVCIQQANCTVGVVSSIAFHEDVLTDTITITRAIPKKAVSSHD